MSNKKDRLSWPMYVFYGIATIMIAVFLFGILTLFDDLRIARNGILVNAKVVALEGSHNHNAGAPASGDTDEYSYFPTYSFDDNTGKSWVIKPVGGLTTSTKLHLTSKIDILVDLSRDPPRVRPAGWSVWQGYSVILLGGATPFFLMYFYGVWAGNRKKSATA